MGNPDPVAEMLQASFECQPVDGDTLQRAQACYKPAPPPCPALGELSRLSKAVSGNEPQGRQQPVIIMKTAADTVMRPVL